MAGNTATTDDLLSLRGIHQRVDTYQFDVVDSSNNVLGQVQPSRDGNQEVQNDTSRDIYRSLTGFELDASQAADVNTASDRIRPSMSLQNGTTFPLGVFLFGDASHGVRSWGSELAGTMVDQMFILRQPVGRVVGFSAGDDPIAAAVSIAQEVITGAIYAASTSLTLAGPIAFKIDDTRQTIINTLLAGVAYLPCYFDNSGTLQMAPARALPVDTPDFSYEAWTATNGGSIVKDSIVLGDDFLKSPNRYIVVDNSATASAIVGTYDIPSSAPNSFAARGFYVVKPVMLQGLASVAAANDAAMAAYLADAAQFRRVTFASAHNPRHDTFNIVDLLGDQYREIGWRIRLRSGEHMQHDLRQAYS